MRKRDPGYDKRHPAIRPRRCRFCGGSGKMPGKEAYPTEALKIARFPEWVECRYCEGTGRYPPEAHSYEGLVRAVACDR